MQKPATRPQNPCFSSGPCPKRPGWNPEVLAAALLGRSHRSKEGKARLKEAIDRTRKVLGVPDDYRIGIVPASDTGAVEMALWSLLGPRPVDVLAWESFGAEWVSDVTESLRLPTLLVRGGLSDVLSEEGARDFLALAPHAEYANITDAGHMVAGDRNDVFGHAVIDFLSRMVPLQGAPRQSPHALNPHHEGPPGDVTDVP